jgi:hypothetical protein
MLGFRCSDFSRTVWKDEIEKRFDPNMVHLYGYIPNKTSFVGFLETD